jgi:hypothetical protein
MQSPQHSPRQPLTAGERPVGVAKTPLATPGKIDHLRDERDGPVIFEDEIEDRHRGVPRTNLIGLEIGDASIRLDDQPVHRLMAVKAENQKNGLHNPPVQRL